MESPNPVVGLLHPGEMGALLGGALRAVGTDVRWTSDGRSVESRARADVAGLTDAGSLARLVAGCDLLLAVCPPHAAVGVADSVSRLGFGGVFVDANAVAPATAERIRDLVTAAGARFVDGDVIGGPVRPGGAPRLFLSGDDAETVAGLFAPTPVRAQVIGRGFEASALKMCYASWTKGTAALLLAVRALAQSSGVDVALVEEWSRSQPDLAARCEAAVAVAGRGWRFAGEMEEIASAMAADGLPDGFALAAADIYRRLAGFKGDSPTAGQVLAALTEATP